MSATIKVGAVVYAPRVTVIWDLIKKHGVQHDLDIQPVLYKDYKLQVDGMEKGEIDVAWNSPLSHLDAHQRFGGAEKFGPQRDTDLDLHTVLITRKDSGISSVKDLAGKMVGFGAIDSPQARLIPAYFLHTQGLELGSDYVEKRFEVGIGLHGDHVGGEQDAAVAMAEGRVDASFAAERNFEAWCADGTLDANEVCVVDKTSAYDHCIFTAVPTIDDGLLEQFSDALLAMDYGKESEREIMDLEGLKKWVPGRVTGYELITQADAYLGGFLHQFNAQ